MLRAYLDGARRAAARWPLVTILWLLGSLCGAAFALATAAWLSDALEGSLATRTLFREIDANVLVDLYYHHGEGLRMLGVVAALLAAIHTALWWWLHGVLVLALQPDDDREALWSRGLALTPLMVELFVIALVALAVFSAALAGPAYALLRWTRTDPSAFIWYRIGGTTLACWLLGVTFLVAVHDHARIRAVRAGDGAFAAYRWALAFVLRGGERAFPLALLLQVSSVALWAAYQVVGFSFPMTALLGLTGSLLWGAAFLWLRVWVRAWFFAAQTDLQA